MVTLQVWHETVACSLLVRLDLEDVAGSTGGKPPGAANTPQTSDEQHSANDDAGAVIHYPPKGAAASVLAASMLLGAVAHRSRVHGQRYSGQ